MGVIALLFMIGWAALMIGGRNSGSSQILAASSLRIGMVLGAIWLALPQLSQLRNRTPPWLIGTLLGGAIVIAVRPRLFVYVLPIAAVIALLQFVGWVFQPPRQS